MSKKSRSLTGEGAVRFGLETVRARTRARHRPRPPVSCSSHPTRPIHVGVQHRNGMLLVPLRAPVETIYFRFDSVSIPPPGRTSAMPSSSALSALQFLRVSAAKKGAGLCLTSQRARPFGASALAPGRPSSQERHSSSGSARGRGGSGAHEPDEGKQFLRPPTIQWEKDLANAVQLIGRVSRDVDLRYLESGKVLAKSVLAVKERKNDDPSLFDLELWDGLAEIAAHHLKNGEEIFVTGRIVVDKWVKADCRYSTPKVIVRDFCFVEPYDSQRQTYGQSGGVRHNECADMGSTSWAAQEAPSAAHSQPSRNQYTSPNSSRKGTTVQTESLKTQDDMIGTEKKWQEYFADPTQWWDNRNSKRNPKAPDFKHKSTQEALWLNSWSNPPWVAQQMAILEERKAQHAGDAASFQRGFQEQKLSSFRDSDFLY